MRAFFTPLFLFHDALKRMLVFAGEIHNLRYFRFRNFIGINSTLTDAMIMYMEHYARCFFDRLVKVLA